ncbi:MHYT domain-containing protein [Mongoliimonas terrestris]|uniref:MHYT domain-containing protein n=1 Tax=Mongoliimonas terrestris TaxID=1709001 RepID=UPI000949A96B|nr:MHYT domain-containing protein [Mongoliimonas terrestris]
MHVGSHDRFLVILSVLIAIAAAYTALDLAGRIRASDGIARKAWTGAAAVAMGGGIWSMHFIAMLAFHVTVPVLYDGPLTLASLLLAVAATGAGFIVASGGTTVRIAAAGLLMGFGIGTMHYLGMAAMRMDAVVSYDTRLVVLSLLVAVGASTVGLWTAFRATRAKGRILAATALGVAVSGMHYTAMAAATFTPTGPTGAEDGPVSLVQTQLAGGVAAATLVILLLASVAALFDRRFGMLAEREAAALRQSEARFRALYRETPLPLYALGPGGRIDEVSDAWLALLGLDRAAALGRPLTDFMEPASAAAYRTRTPSPPAGPAPADGNRVGEEAEYFFRTADGRILDVAVHEREHDAGLDAPRILGALRDMTERKRLEADLRQAQKLESIGQLTGGMAHDFNNLLAVIIGNMDLLARRVGDDERSRRMVESATAAATRGAALTQRMLAFARRQDLKPQPTDVAALVHDMGDLLVRSLGPEIRLERSLPADLPAAMVDANQLEMALVNLTVNARDAMPDGGTVTIAARHAAAPPDGDPATGDGFVVVSVTDAGAGMDAATLARAVDPFFTTKGIGKGTGLGLSMVQGLAAQSGGRLRIESAPGAGTTAELWLPAADVPAVRPLAPSEPAPPAGIDRPLRVLVVDDDPLVLMGTLAMLEDLGHTVIEAESGATALDRLRTGARPDVLVTDFAMPTMTGRDLIDAVRRIHPGLPAVLASGYADLRRADGLDAVHLPKPFHQGDLARALAQAVRRSVETADA